MMNGFSEIPQEVQEVKNETQDLSIFERIECGFETIKEGIENYWEDLKDTSKELYEDVSDFAQEIKDTVNDVLGLNESEDVKSEQSDAAREYGLHECAESAKEIITSDVINSWGTMSLEERNEIAQEYAAAIGEGLGINYKGIVWEEFDTSDGTYTYGYNQGDGYVHLNSDFLCDPSMLMQLVDTVAHEARHQLQTEAIADPERFGIDEATINEWAVGKLAYTTEMPSAYDPWGYTYNPLEIDSKYFGESMVREITKGLINA